MNLNAAYSRLIMPVFFALAIFWAVGFDRFLANSMTKKIVLIIFVGTVTVFVTAEFTKAFIASSAWNRYEEDFAWVRDNTLKESHFYYRGQCLSYNINRPVDFQFDEPEAYLWVNPDFPLEPVSEINATILKEFSRSSRVYQNNNTLTEIYRVWR